VHHGHGPVLRESRIQSAAVGGVAHNQRSPFDRLAVAIDEVVIDHGRIARQSQRLAGMAADVSGAAGDKDAGVGHGQSCRFGKCGRQFGTMHTR